MQALRRKLKNRQGASMLMAMLLLLVAVMVSAVVLAAAAGLFSCAYHPLMAVRGTMLFLPGV